ncbi:hypothetical protein D9M71_587940 [compost metagenome]
MLAPFVEAHTQFTGEQPRQGAAAGAHFQPPVFQGAVQFRGLQEGQADGPKATILRHRQVQRHAFQGGDLVEDQPLHQEVMRLCVQLFQLDGTQDQLPQQRRDRQHAAAVEAGRRGVGGDEQGAHLHLAGHEDLVLDAWWNPYRLRGRYHPGARVGDQTHQAPGGVEKLRLGMKMAVDMGAVRVIPGDGAHAALLVEADDHV